MIDHPLVEELHLAGRLDRASTGLVVITNNGRWPKRVTEPGGGVFKRYLVETRDAVTEETAAVFARGVYFAYEDLTTRSAEMEVLAPRRVRPSIREGRYHQVKRMFHAVGNRVTALRRESIGELVLDANLAPGRWRMCSAELGWRSAPWRCRTCVRNPAAKARLELWIAVTAGGGRLSWGGRGARAPGTYPPNDSRVK